MMHPEITPMASTSAPETEALATLHTRTVDALNGYAKMVEKAEPAFRPTAEAFRALHARHADALARILSDAGHDSEPSGSLMGTVNRTVVAVRAFFDEIDADLMDHIRSGEDHVLTAFDDAMAAGLPPAVAAEVTEMHRELRALVSRTQGIG